MPVTGGSYVGSATVGGYEASVELSSVPLRRSRWSPTISNTTEWSGVAFIDDPAADLSELFEQGAVEVVIGARVGTATITGWRERDGRISLTGLDDPPFDPTPHTGP